MTGGEDITLDFSTPGGFDVVIRQQFRDVEDIDFFADDIENFQTHVISVDIARELAEKTDGLLTCRFRQKDYDADTLFDWDQHQVRVRSGYEVADKADVYASVEVGVQDSDGNDDEGTYYNGIIGVATELSDKVVVSAGGGVVGLDSDTDDFSEFGFEASLTWEASDRVIVTGQAEKYIQPASIDANNYDVVSVIRTDLRYVIMNALQLTLTGSYYLLDLENDFETSTGEIIDKEEEVLTGRARLDYQSPADFLELFLEAEITNQESTEDGVDYDQEMVSAGARLKY